MFRIVGPLHHFYSDAAIQLLSSDFTSLRIAEVDEDTKALMQVESRAAVFGVIGESTTPPADRRGTRQAIMRVLDAIRLTVLWRVSMPWLYSFPGSVAIGSPGDLGPSQTHFQASDIATFQQIWAAMIDPALPPKLLEAVRWFANARARAHVNDEERAVNLSICAEALFLDNGGGEKAKPIGRRAEHFAGAFAADVAARFDRADAGFHGSVGEHLWRAYRLRNGIVHAEPTALQEALQGATLGVFCHVTEWILRHCLIRALDNRQLPPRV